MKIINAEENDENDTVLISSDSDKDKSTIGYLLNLSELLQIVLACYTKVHYTPLHPGEVVFKAEYILPQFLLQWLKSKGIFVDGIRYESCSGNLKFPTESKQYNYILPVQYSNHSRYCPFLLNAFDITPVHSSFKKFQSLEIFSHLQSVQNELQSTRYLPFARL